MNSVEGKADDLVTGNLGYGKQVDPFFLLRECMGGRRSQENRGKYEQEDFSHMFINSGKYLYSAR